MNENLKNNFNINDKIWFFTTDGDFLNEKLKNNFNINDKIWFFPTDGDFLSEGIVVGIKIKECYVTPSHLIYEISYDDNRRSDCKHIFGTKESAIKHRLIEHLNKIKKMQDEMNLLLQL